MQLIKDVLLREPAIITGLLVSGVVVVAAELGFVIDEASAQAIIAPIVAGVISRFFVVPANEVVPTVSSNGKKLKSSGKKLRKQR